MRLKHKVAVITGAGSGFGRASAVLFAKEGAKVVVADINETTGRETVDLVADSGHEAEFLKADVAKDAEVSALVKLAIEKFGRLDVMFNNAGTEMAGAIGTMTEEIWNRVIDVNLKGVWLGCKYAFEAMQGSGGGSIINTASMSGYCGRPFMSVYTASKGGIIGMTKALAMEGASANIRVNCLCPIVADTPMGTRFFKFFGEAETIREVAVRDIPLNRLCNAEDVANFALFLASDESSFITGLAIPVDGGVSAR